MRNISMLTHQSPIKSQSVGGLVDNLNAEIVLGKLHRAGWAPE